MKTGLIMEGGAMRGIFTAGVIDVLMENGIVFDGAIGVSAGAVFGCNYKSRQIGRTLRYNLRFCKDPRYASIRSWLKTGDYFNAEFDYHEIPEKLDPFDTDTYRSNPMEFWAVATDAATGKPVYHKCETGEGEDVQWLRASASMPGFSNMVRLDGMELSDGGTSDSVPLKKFEEMGYDRNVVIETRPAGYRKSESKASLRLLKKPLKAYPALYAAIKNRHVMYNAEMDYIDGKAASGEIILIRPSEALPIGRIEHDEKKIRNVYGIGRRAGEDNLERIADFLRERR